LIAFWVNGQVGFKIYHTFVIKLWLHYFAAQVLSDNSLFFK